MAKHGVFANKQVSQTSAPVVSESGVPFVIGVSPIQAASEPARVGMPVICENFEEAQAKLGYSDNWEAYPLCEFMYSQFMLYEAGPVIFCNLLDPATAKESVAAADFDVVDHQVLLPIDAINDTTLVVKAQGSTGSETTYVKGEDYDVYYSGDNLVVELIPTGDAYAAEELNVAYSKATPDSITATNVATGLEAIEHCMTTVGVIPDLICAPGYSQDESVAAVMATKAAGVAGMFHAKAVVDIDASSSGATTYSAAISKKEELELDDENVILCWPAVSYEGKVYHRSTHLCGVMARTDRENGNCPYVSPSNQSMVCDGMCLEDGSEVLLTVTQANELNYAGIVTGLNAFLNWVAWGNYTACWPGDTKPEDCFIPVARMFDWVGNTLVKTCWKKLDGPITMRLLESIVDAVNIWFNGLMGSGFIYGGRVEMLDEENPTEDIMQGIVRFHVYMAPPSPAQEIDFVQTYDASYVETALAG